VTFLINVSGTTEDPLSENKCRASPGSSRERAEGDGQSIDEIWGVVALDGRYLAWGRVLLSA